MNVFELGAISKSQMDFQGLDMMVKGGMAKYAFDIGSTIKFNLKNGREVVARAVDFDVYREHEVIFVMEDIYWIHRMNRRDTNAGGWAHSEMADYMDEILREFPDELAAIIKPRTIQQNIGGTVYERTSALWVPSIIEMGDNAIGRRRGEYQAIDVDNKQFEWFKTPRNRIKSLDLEDGSKESTYPYWERSPYASNSPTFVCVNLGGYPSGSYGAGNTYGVVVGFSI